MSLPAGSRHADDRPPSYSLSFPAYHGAQYDASVTNLTYSIPSPNTSSKADALEIVLSFLSPVTPTSTLRQAIPASYLQIEVKGNFDVDVYVDLNGQWVSGNKESEVVWELANNGFEDVKSLKTWKIQRKDEERFVESHDRAEWGTLHFTAPNVSHLAASGIGATLETPAKGVCRMSITKAARLQALDKDLPGPEPFETKLIRLSAALWMMSLSLHSRSHSNYVGTRRPLM